MAAPLIRRSFLALLAAAAAAACMTSQSPVPDAPIRIFLVRHAEKQAGDDPALTAEGEARAAALVSRLAGEGVTEIWSTQTRRTQQTAAPVAARLGLKVQAYDAKALPDLAGTLTATPGTKLVVGHSNTTGNLAGLLGADPGPVVADTEYDRLYLIEIGTAARVRSRIERYGAPVIAAEGSHP